MKVSSWWKLVNVICLGRWMPWGSWPSPLSTRTSNTVTAFVCSSRWEGVTYVYMAWLVTCCPLSRFLCRTPWLISIYLELSPEFSNLAALSCLPPTGMSLQNCWSPWILGRYASFPFPSWLWFVAASTFWSFADIGVLTTWSISLFSTLPSKLPGVSTFAVFRNGLLRADGIFVICSDPRNRACCWAVMGTAGLKDPPLLAGLSFPFGMILWVGVEI